MIPIQLQSISYRCGISGVCPIVREKDVHVVLPWQKAHKNTTVLKELGIYATSSLLMMTMTKSRWGGTMAFWAHFKISGKSTGSKTKIHIPNVLEINICPCGRLIEVWKKTAIMWTRRIAWIGGFPLELLQEVWDESLHPDDAHSTGAATSSSTTLPNCESSLKMGTHLVGASTN